MRRRNSHGGRAFSALLHKRGVKPQELADALGVSRGVVSHWALGRRKPSSDHMEAIARILGVTTDEVLALFAEKD